MKDPVLPPDTDARTLARSLIAQARHGALGVLQDGHPMVTRIGLATAPDGAPLALISTLSQHSAALQQDPRCSLLLGEPGPTGDPLTHPRLSLQAGARFVRQGDADHPALADHFLALRPKSKLYIGFADFFFCRFEVQAGFLNGGFGRAYRLTPADLHLA